MPSVNEALKGHPFLTLSADDGADQGTRISTPCQRRASSELPAKTARASTAQDNLISSISTSLASSVSVEVPAVRDAENYLRPEEPPPRTDVPECTLTSREKERFYGKTTGCKYSIEEVGSKWWSCARCEKWQNSQESWWDDQ